MDFIHVTLLIGIIFISIAILVVLLRQFQNNSDEVNFLDQRIHDKKITIYDNLDKESKIYTKIPNENLEKLIRKAEFGDISEGLFHDLINPLTSISLYLEKIESEVDAISSKKSVERVANISKNINNYIGSMKCNIGNIVKTDISSTNITESISTVLDMYRFRLQKQNVEVSIHTSDMEDIYLPINEIRLNQIFINLISNSLDAIDKKHIIDRDHTKRIDISGKIIDNTNEHRSLLISIQDNGIGMKNEEKEKVFRSPFTTKQNGSGVGLVTVKTIVENELHGKIYFESVENEYTTFYIKIPI